MTTEEALAHLQRTCSAPALTSALTAPHGPTSRDRRRTPGRAAAGQVQRAPPDFGGLATYSQKTAPGARVLPLPAVSRPAVPEPPPAAAPLTRRPATAPLWLHVPRGADPTSGSPRWFRGSGPGVSSPHEVVPKVLAPDIVRRFPHQRARHGRARHQAAHTALASAPRSPMTPSLADSADTAPARGPASRQPAPPYGRAAPPGSRPMGGGRAGGGGADWLARAPHLLTAPQRRSGAGPAAVKRPGPAGDWLAVPPGAVVTVLLLTGRVPAAPRGCVAASSQGHLEPAPSAPGARACAARSSPRWGRAARIPGRWLRGAASGREDGRLQLFGSLHTSAGPR